MDNPDDITLEDAARQAIECAADTDPVGMLSVLERGGWLIGLARRVQSRYSAFDREDAHHVVGVVVDKLYETARRGQTISSPVSWLVKVAFNTASDYDSARRRDGATDPTDFRQGELARAAENQLADRAINEPDAVHAARVRHGIAAARTLLPKLGQENVRRVMELYIDAVEKGIPHLPDAEVAQIVGSTPGNVRVWKKRGFDRLARKAAEAGFGDVDIQSMVGTHSNQDNES